MSGPRKEGEVGTTPKELAIYEIPEVYRFCDLERASRNVRLTNVRGIYPYLNARISLEEISIDLLVPTARYVLRNNLRTQDQLREQLLIFGIDPCHLDSNLAAARLNGSGGAQILVPPIIEKSVEDDGVNAITDGLHRIVNAKAGGEDSISVLKIEGSAVPLPVKPVQWDEVEAVDEVPPLSTKRKLRFSNSRELFTWFGLTGERLANLLSGVKENDSLGYTMMFRSLGMEDISRGMRGRGRVDEQRRLCNTFEVVVYDQNGDAIQVKKKGNPEKWGNVGAKREAGETPEMTAAIAVWEDLGVKTVPFLHFRDPDVVLRETETGEMSEVSYVYNLQTHERVGGLQLGPEVIEVRTVGTDEAS